MAELSEAHAGVTSSGALGPRATRSTPPIPGFPFAFARDTKKSTPSQNPPSPPRNAIAEQPYSAQSMERFTARCHPR